ncbi:BPI fold-containing family B member 1 [Sturnira hondurensis]|uniref:BPI fold-containing family B member 1 n=1 Tax=Sturnira hondurensis TaxID=192404 RepID=UPI00187A103A|nr:BPI fold-containing family B member 1 [Sturnira hondurensis]XP_036899770.1 BPI fold-containing family B member 1 [Sturnira hondurensis]
MASSRTFTLVCGLLAATLVGATLSPPAVLTLGPEVISEKLTQGLKKHNAVNILQQLPLLSAIREDPAGGIPILGSLVNSVLDLIIWLKVTSANILQVQVQPSADKQGLVVTIPLDMVAGFNTPLISTIVEMHMETEAQAIIRVETNSKDQTTRLVLQSCSNSRGSLRVSLLQNLSFLVNPLANNVMKLLVPALPKLVKSQLCPVIKEALEDMQEDLLRLVRLPVPVGHNHLNFDLLYPAIKGNVIQLNLAAKLLDSEENVKKSFNESAVSLTMPALDSSPFTLTMRRDVVNGAIAALIPPEEAMVLLDYVLPELALRLKSNIRAISEKAANQLGHTQIMKTLLQESPELLLDQGNAKVAQLIVLEIFATNEVQRPFFTLGIEASSDAQFHTEGDQLILSLNELSADQIHLLNSYIDPFNPELLKDITEEILASALLPNENGKLRPVMSVPIVKDLGFKEASWSLTKDALVITPASA